MSDRLQIALGWFDAKPQEWVEGHEPLLTIADAARRFLALTETGQRVEWCEFHESPVSWWPFTDPQSNARCLWWSHSADPSDCHVVPKFLADYLTEETE